MIALFLVCVTNYYKQEINVKPMHLTIIFHVFKVYERKEALLVLSQSQASEIYCYFVQGTGWFYMMALIIYMHKGIVLHFWNLLATQVRNWPEVWLLPINFIFKPLFFLNPANFVNFNVSTKKVKFPSIFWHGLLEETNNLVHFLSACKIPSPTD